MASTRSSTVYRKRLISRCNIIPSEMMTRGLPIISLRNLADFSIIPDIITSRHTSVSIGTTPIIIGMELSSTGIAAMLDMRMVTTSSDG